MADADKRVEDLRRHRRTCCFLKWLYMLTSLALPVAVLVAVPVTFPGRSELCLLTAIVSFGFCLIGLDFERMERETKAWILEARREAGGMGG